jgi:hypothetical protein
MGVYGNEISIEIGRLNHLIIKKDFLNDPTKLCLKMLIA